MYRRVMVPLDGSAFAEHALPYAALAAGQAGGALELVLVHTSYSVATMDAAIHETIERWQADQREREADYLEAVAARILDETGVPARPVLLTGGVAGAIAQHAAHQSPDLIVMTTHGRGGLERAWLGSVADALIRQVTAPVLLVRPSDLEPGLGESRPLFRHVVIALDGSNLAEHALQTIRGLADRETLISLLRVVMPTRRTVPGLPTPAALFTRERAREAETYLADVAARLRTDFAAVEPHVLTDYHPAAAIVAWAREHGADGIALSTHGRAPALRLLLGSITDEVVRKGSVPVLVG